MKTRFYTTLVLSLLVVRVQAASTTFDDFNVNEGHFTANPPTGSGSTANVAGTSTADRVTTDGPLEGTGHQRIVLNATTPGTSMRLRHLSGGGTIGNNTAFATSDGPDGWIGCYLKTTDPDWTIQIWIEGTGVGNNGSVPKDIIADGEWHLYEWDLEDFTGGPDGWGTIQNIIAGSATVTNGNHTIDSIIFRNANGPAASTLYLDFVARNDSGSVSNLLADPCLQTSGVLVTGPLSTNSNEVVVTGVSGTATALTVYQNAGPSGSMVAIGTKTSGITASNNTVTVSGLVKNAQVSATQTVAGQESCVSPTGIFVGGGANPSVRIALSIRETSGAGPIGEPNPDNPASGNIHFLGATGLSGGAPINAPVIYPSNNWQTVTFWRGTNETVGDSATATGVRVNGAGYAANDVVSVMVYAFRTLSNGTSIYSAAPPTSSDVTSNDVFNVNWTWDAVPGATGYRLLRSTNFTGYLESVDVNATSYTDTNGGWTTNVTVLPNTAQSGRSVKWNTGGGDLVGTTNNLPNQWGILEAIAFVINGDVGPFDLYIDNLKNGDTVFQTFEEGNAGTGDYGFRAPRFSGTTEPGLLATPEIGLVSNIVADAGTNSFRVAYQWNGTNVSRWVRLTTSGVGNPQVDLDQPLSFRLLLLPVGSSPTGPAPGPLSITREGANVILNWSGSYQLQSATSVIGPYTNVTGITTAPYTNATATGMQFFRLAN